MHQENELLKLEFERLNATNSERENVKNQTQATYLEHLQLVKQQNLEIASLKMSQQRYAKEINKFEKQSAKVASSFDQIERVVFETKQNVEKTKEEYEKLLQKSSNLNGI